ncbi:glycosyltransferase family 1 protein [Lysobacter firmicutimachus]|uniref:Glycosyltransferase family 1 protein n=1 Tax=Lysobacter firmicutimachus TaxID=1792846 RepID=A0ABU8CZP1_9GAMM
MRIAVDLQSCQTDSRDRGIGRYAMSLVAALAMALPEGDELVIAIDGTDDRRASEVRRELRRAGVGAKVVAYNYPASRFTDQSQDLVAAAGTLRSQFFRSLDPDVVLVSSFFELGSNFTTELDEAVLDGIKTAVIAYDLIPLLYPDRYLRPGEFVSSWYPAKIERFKKFDMFFAISKATKRDLIEHLGIEPERIHVIDAGWDDKLAVSAHSDGVDRITELGIDRPYVLMVGNADWRKNCMGVLRAFSDLPASVSKEHQLVFTQVGQDVRDALEKEYAHLRDRVIVAGKVDEATLAQLYRRCRVFYFPSLYEGFGLPVLEAMAFNVPVLSSSLGALPEVVHDERVLFDPADAAASERILRRALQDEAFRESLSRGAREHALQFTWERCARLLLDGLRERSVVGCGEERSPWIPQNEDVQRFARAMMQTEADFAAGLKFGLESIASRGRRRILVDITEVVRLDARSGIQRVVRNYMAGLFRAAHSSNDAVVEPICWTEDGVQYARSFARERFGLDCEGADDLVQAFANDLVFMVDSSWWSPSRFDELHRQVGRAGGEIVWMVYDLVPINAAEYCDPVMPPVFSQWLEHVAATADGCVCISEATRADLERFFDELKIESRPWTRSLHLGSDLESGRVAAPSELAAEVIEKIGAAPLFVALSTLEPRKDYATILTAFEGLWATGADAVLVIIGKQGWNVEALAERIRKHSELGRRLFWLDAAGDGDVQALLSKATALIQASVAEGFGLAVVEAGSLGVPLILSDLAVFREIAADEASYFAVGDPDGLAGIISQSLLTGRWLKPVGIRTMTWAESSSRLLALLMR